MLLLSDVGNTNTVLGLYDGETQIARWAVRTIRERTPDEWGLMFKSLFEFAGLPLSVVSGAALSSVVPPAVHALKAACHRYLETDPLIVGPGIRTGLILRFDNPREVGADRIVNAVAARERFSGACIVVDFGTATTLDCITGRGEYIGGIICPGIGISLDALVSRTSKLPKVEIVRPPAVIGKSTEHAMQSGIYFGYASMVDGLAARLSAEMDEPVTVIATGGLAGIIAAESSTITVALPDLTLDGLRILFFRNRKPTV